MHCIPVAFNGPKHSAQTDHMLFVAIKQLANLCDVGWPAVVADWPRQITAA